jgi:uncharacterized membrane protein YidH (DUF202 family)
MFLFRRLFASYYFFCLQLRVISKSRIEDFQAMVLTALVPMLLFFAITNNQNFINYSSPITKPVLVVICLALMSFGYFYFLSNGARRNKIIDEYRYLPLYKKNLWMIFSLLMIIIPLIIMLSG